MQKKKAEKFRKHDRKKKFKLSWWVWKPHLSVLILSPRREAGHSGRLSIDFIWPSTIFFYVSAIWFLLISPRDFFSWWIINYSLCQFSMAIEFCRNLPTIKLSMCKKWFATYSAFPAILRLSKSTWDLKTQLAFTVNPWYTFLVTLSLSSFQPYSRKLLL